jgi:hypothetical protein
MGWTAGVRFPTRQVLFFSLRYRIQTDYGTHIVTEAYCPELKRLRHEADD